MLLCFECFPPPLVKRVLGQGTPLQGPLHGATDGGLAAAAAAGGLSFEVVSSGSDGGNDDGDDDDDDGDGITPSDERREATT